MSVKADEKHTITLEVRVPIAVDEGKRAKFEDAMTNFILGHDRIRPELHDALVERGVDIKRLNELSTPEKLGVCRSKDAMEFIPTPELVGIGNRAGIDFRAGGKLNIEFDYSNSNASSTDVLEMKLQLPSSIEGVASGQVGNIMRSLFGDCHLSVRAQDYLLAHGIDIADLAAQNIASLGNGSVPPTARVDKSVADTLDQFGLNTARLGKIQVTAMAGDEAPLNANPPMAWRKTTCC